MPDQVEVTQEDREAVSGKMLNVARRNLRTFIGLASFKCENDREAALNCLDVIEADLSGLNDLVVVLRSALAADAAVQKARADALEEAAKVLLEPDERRLRELAGFSDLYDISGGGVEGTLRELRTILAGFATAIRSLTEREVSRERGTVAYDPEELGVEHND